MIVTFICECEKNALKRTRKVLDAFANRIGSNVWQTPITEEGLEAVKKSLKMTASKSTAVACHKIKGHRLTELLWIVGNRLKFNNEGLVPVNVTSKNIIKSHLESSNNYLGLIRSLTALSALLHDWGKASLCFQKKLKSKKKNQSDPLRHEWISLLLFTAFVDNSSDEQWLKRMAAGNIQENQLKKINNNDEEAPMAKLPLAAKIIAWLIVSHHRLPNRKGAYGEIDFEGIFELIKSNWNYENSKNNIDECFKFLQGLLSNSSAWLKDLKRWSGKLLDNLALLKEAQESGSMRLILLYCRTCLMLGDHNYSSEEADKNWRSRVDLYANTDKDKNLKQKLDEHLVGVSKTSLEVINLLPQLENSDCKAYDIKSLKEKSTNKKFYWQDKAVSKILEWKENLDKSESNFGFFAVNMASTGCGKTIVNAKIMQALAEDCEGLRYILALGLRTLTLQTGDEYRKRIGISKDDLAVLIGSQAILDLHNQKQSENNAEEEYSFEEIGSESWEDLLEKDQAIKSSFHVDSENKLLKTLLKNKKHQQFLYAPVLSCTIDHLISAVTCHKGGKYILPVLRLMSSDLVIDEIDDFNGDDLIIIGRLIHLAAMLGRKVMISSATIPPAMAQGYFNAYRQGWEIYSKYKSLTKSIIGCAFIDEFNSKIETIKPNDNCLNSYEDLHQKFINKRVEKLIDTKFTPIKRWAKIVSCAEIININQESETSKQALFFNKIKETAIDLHRQHFQRDKQLNKNFSFGVIRIANIDPAVELAQYLLQPDIWQKEPDIDAKIMVYHSRQVMLLRSAQEKHLDQVLNRKNPSYYKNPIIQKHLQNSNKENIIFILVATPVEEIGRDHDFDWAIIEPSSFRSIIQLAGRVLRHTNQIPKSENIAIMEYNLRYLKGEKPCYKWPGYEQNKENYQFKEHSLFSLIEDKEGLLKTGKYPINSIPRIKANKELKPTEKLADLEHFAVKELLMNFNKNSPNSLNGWLKSYWWLSGQPQIACKFRDSQGQETRQLYLIKDQRSGEFVFKERTKSGSYEKAENGFDLEIDRQPNLDEKLFKQLWLTEDRNYKKLLEEQIQIHKKNNHKNYEEEEEKEKALEKLAKKYGEINIAQYRNNGSNSAKLKFYYHDQFGLWKKK